GTASAVCTNGQWTPSQLGTCIGFPAITTPLGAILSYSNLALLGPFSEGTTVTARCLNGKYPLGASLSTCQNGQWTPPLGSCPNSGAIQCTLPPALPIGATVTYSSGNMFGPWNSGAVATMACPLAQTVVGSTTSICNNGVWSPLGTPCLYPYVPFVVPLPGTEFPCYLGLLEPLNGSIRYTNSKLPYQPGTIATLTCKVGYIVSGAATSVCVNGSFATIGTCNAL
uniref:Sushi domain-containing protein n=1 Tax=Angiostrongylus cantonensis TaxID=6313 RepID=A0A158PA33_ANGCA